MNMKCKNNIYIYGFWATLFFERSVWINYLKYNHYSIVEIGFLQTLLTLTMFLSELPSGLLTDKFGAKNYVCRALSNLPIFIFYDVEYKYSFYYIRFYVLWHRSSINIW